MNKKIKVIELFDIIAKGIDIPARVEYKQKIYKFDSDIMDYVSQDEELCLSLVIAGYDNFKESLNGEVEILEDEEEIDIENFEEIKGIVAIDEKGYITRETFIDFVNKINDLVKAVKQLDKKINKE
jgi:hypothetical protein